MKFIVLSIAGMFIKLTVTNFLTLETLLFLNFEMKILNLTQTKRLPNPVLFLFPDSCFDLAGRSLKEKTKKEVKSMSPTLIDEPLCKTGINQRCTFFFLGNVWHVYQLSRHGNPVNIISFERHSLLNFHIKDKYWNWSQKARNQILDTSISPLSIFSSSK